MEACIVTSLIFFSAGVSSMYFINFQDSEYSSSFASDRDRSEPQSGDVVNEEFTTLHSPSSHSNVYVTREVTSSMRPAQFSDGYTITREVRSSGPARAGSHMVTSHEFSSLGRGPAMDHSSTVTRGVTSTRAPLRGGSVTTVTREMTSGRNTSPRSPSQYASEVPILIPLFPQHYLRCKMTSLSSQLCFYFKTVFNFRS